MFKLISKTIAAVAIVSVALFGSANAKTLKIETHFTASSPNGEVAAQFAKNVEMFSGGSLKIEMFYSSSVTGKSAEVFNSAQTGIIDCDMTGAGYQTGKNAAFLPVWYPAPVISQSIIPVCAELNTSADLPVTDDE